MKVPLWIRVSAVVFSAFVGGMYVAYATGFHGFIGDIPSGSEPIQPGPISADEVPFPKFTEDLFIPSSKSGGIFSPPTGSADDSEEVDTESPTAITIPQAGLPELGLFGPEASLSPPRFPIEGLKRNEPKRSPEALPEIDLDQRQFMPSTKSFSPLHVHPPQPNESK